MNVYITKLNGMGNTMQSMQKMAAEIAHQLDFREMGIYYYNANGESPERRSARFDGMIAGMSAGDVVICQFHTWNGLKFERGLVERIKAYHGRVVIFIHSVEALMIKSSRFMLEEIIELYNQAEALIVPSYEMKKFLQNPGIRTGIKDSMKFIVQEMWDCVTDIHFRGVPKLKKEIHCISNFDAQFINNWNFAIPLNLYASVAAKGQNVHCKGVLGPDELLLRLSEGGFGLEWYSNEYNYQYMRYSISFSLSRYLAAGIPVIVPTGISSQKLIEENHLGLVVDSLDEAVKRVEDMNEAEYLEYVQYVEKFAPALRNGYYTKKCLIESVQTLFREDTSKGFAQTTDIYDVNDYAPLTVIQKKSYGDNIALSWNLKGQPDGFLIYNSSGNLIEEIENIHQHYLLINVKEAEKSFFVNAYVKTQRGKMIVAKTKASYLNTDLNNSPLVSIVMPAYNAEDYIVRSIDTILAQSFSELELVIVDDGSTDHTPDIIDWYAENYPNVIAIHQKNEGVQAARNAGIRYAKGEYIGFVDSDDMIRPYMVERLYTSAKKNQCDIAVTSVHRIENKGYVSLMQYSMKEDVAVTVEEFLQMYAIDGYALPAVWNKLYRASLVKEHLFPLIKFEDEAWTPCILSYATRICYLNDCSYEYDRSICSDSLVKQWLQKPNDEVFQDHKRSILFYLEHGNQKQVKLLQEVAKSELSAFGKITGYAQYEELRKQIVEICK